MTNINNMRTAIESNCKCFLGWTIPASQEPSQMRFSPLAVAEFLDGFSQSAGAIRTYVWQMAFADTREAASLAMRNLAGLFSADDFGGPEDFTEELVAC